MSQSSLRLVNPAQATNPAATPERPRLFFLLLILIGMILIAVSVVFLWSELTVGSAAEARLLPCPFF